jgi:hypothetical protein
MRHPICATCKGSKFIKQTPCPDCTQPFKTWELIVLALSILALAYMSCGGLQ